MLIGIEIIALEFNFTHLLLGVCTIFIVLFSRYFTIFIANAFLKKEHRVKRNERIILTWAGLRGGISIALALSLPDGDIKDIILYATYVVVVFSIIVQGLSIEKLVTKLLK